MIRISIILTVLILIDIYAFQGFRVLAKGYSATASRWLYISYWSLSGFCYTLIIIAHFTDWHSWNKYFRMYGFAVLFILMVSKLVLDVFVMTDDIVRAFRWIFLKIASLFQKPEPLETFQQASKISRSEFIIRLGLLVASVPFFSMIYGMAFNAYNYQTRKLKLILPNLPDAFNGFKIVQVSDIHTGSFTSDKHLKDAVNIINEQNADIVFFTGDLVNDQHEEVLPFMDVLKKITAKHGVISYFRKS